MKEGCRSCCASCEAGGPCEGGAAASMPIQEMTSAGAASSLLIAQNTPGGGGSGMTMLGAEIDLRTRDADAKLPRAIPVL